MPTQFGDEPKFFSLILALFAVLLPAKMWAQVAYAELQLASGTWGADDATYTLTFKYGTKPANVSGSLTCFSVDNSLSSPFYAWNAETYKGKITQHIIDESFSAARPKNCSYWFRNAQEIVGLEYLNTSEVTDMRSMFERYNGQTSLDLSHFDTSNVTNMSHMFRSCSGLTSIKLNFNAENLQYCYYMFDGCSSLTSLDLGNFNPDNVKDLRCMFSGCSSLTSLDLSNFTTSNATSTYLMFQGCSSLTSLDVSNFNTSNVTDMSHMFDGCGSLTSLDVSNFNTLNATNMYGMFYRCESLTSLDLSNFDTSNVTDMGSMFRDCYSIKSIDLGDFNVSNVTSHYLMFENLNASPSITITDATGLISNSNLLNKRLAPSNVKEVLFDCELTAEQWETLKTALGDKAKALGPVDGIMKVSMRNGVSDTFCCKYNLDFAAATADGCPLKAYIGSYYVPEASVGEGDLYYSRIQYVPAGTGIILKGGEANVEYEIPVTDMAPVVANLMVGCTKDTPVTALMDGNKTFIYSAKSGALVQVPAAGGTVKARRAYLAIPASLLPWNLSNGAQIRQIFDDEETTGIETLEDASEKDTNGAYYNLNGQHVIAPTKGIYIKNGKKVYVK